MADSAARAQLYRRHDLVWLAPPRLDALPEAVQAWCRTRPLVVARRSPDELGAGKLRLGFCLPRGAATSTQRLALLVDEHAIERYRPPPRLREWRARLPRLGLSLPWQHAVAQLLAFEHRHALTLRSYGSALWLLLSHDPLGAAPPLLAAQAQVWLGADSDLDLLIEVPATISADALAMTLSALDALSRQLSSLGGPRLDGELRWPGLGDVAWREWLALQERGFRAEDRVLVKDACTVQLQSAARLAQRPSQARPDPDWLDALACQALRLEATAWPKPGLVTPRDSGSHNDMTIETLLAAIDALDGWFARMADAAQQGAGFRELVHLGRAAEDAMLHATEGINAYRGAIFNLGLLVAAAAVQAAPPVTAAAVAALVQQRWGVQILAHQVTAASHGSALQRRLGSGGARQQAATGFPVLIGTILPSYRKWRDAGHTPGECLIGACLAGVSALEDTNLLWRGGAEGLRWAQLQAQQWLARGGLQQDDWQAQLQAMHADFVARRLSPGGSADLAACAHFLFELAPGGNRVGMPAPAAAEQA